MALNDGFQYVPDNTDFMNPNLKSVVIVCYLFTSLKKEFSTRNIIMLCFDRR